ncbi:hypothetical protein [Bradyrhizobium sp. RD5-C2]|nr:hypothetical protein [Bradyrhizobium sp. RD5-C2]
MQVAAKANTMPPSSHCSADQDLVVGMRIIGSTSTWPSWAALRR